MEHLGGLDADVFIELGVREGQLHSFLDLLDLLLETAHICIGLQGSLLHLSPQHPMDSAYCTAWQSLSQQYQRKLQT